MPVPVIVSTTPTDQATNVSIDVVVLFAFNTPLRSSTVNEATVGLYRDDTGESIPGRVTLDSDGQTIRFLPRRSLLEQVLYVAAVYGSADNMPGGNLKASDGVDLVTTVSISFRTRTERYVPLSEVTTREDYDRVGPIREESSEATGVLEVVETTPRGFQSNVSRSLSEIRISFGEDVLPTGLGDPLELTLMNVLGMDEYYGEGDPRPPDPSGRYLQDWLPTGDARQALFEVEPSGYVTVSGQYALWNRYPSSSRFHYNTEVTVRIKADNLVNLTGEMLAEDVYLTFTTEYFPQYVGVEYIRLMLGKIIADYYDDTIRRHILAASIDAVDHSAGKFDVEHPYPAVRRYVRALVLVRILDEMGIGPAIQAGSKRLGDLEIKYSPQDLAKVMSIYRKAQSDAEKELLELRDYRLQGKPAVVVKGSDYVGERQDFFMRTWQDLRLSSVPAANTADHRAVKSDLSADHPSIIGRTVRFIGTSDGETVEGVIFPWWK